MFLVVLLELWFMPEREVEFEFKLRAFLADY